MRFVIDLWKDLDCNVLYIVIIQVCEWGAEYGQYIKALSQEMDEIVYLTLGLRTKKYIRRIIYVWMVTSIVRCLRINNNEELL